MTITTHPDPNADAEPDDANASSNADVDQHRDFPEFGSSTHHRPRRSRASIWVTAVAAITMIAGIGYLVFGSANSNQSETVSASGETGGFTESNADGSSDDEEGASSSDDEEGASSSDDEEGASSSDDVYTQGHVVANADGTFLNLEFTNGLDPSQATTTASRSTDGEVWEPVEISGFPPGQIDTVVRDGADFVARVYAIDDTVGIGLMPQGPSRATALSTDGQAWTEARIPAPEPIADWIGTIDVIDAAHLSDGRIVAVAATHWEPDLAVINPALVDAFQTSECGMGQGLDGDVFVVDIMACGSDPAQHFEIPIPAELPPSQLEYGPGGDLWLLNADGTDAEPLFVSEKYPLAVSVSATGDGVRAALVEVVDWSDATEVVPPGSAVASSTDGETWDITPGVSDIDQYGSVDGRPVAEHDGVSYRFVEEFERSIDGGLTWEAPGTFPASDEWYPQFLAAGKAGLVTVIQTSGWTDQPQELDYVADDGTTLHGALGGFDPDNPDATHPWELTTPDGETFTYEFNEMMLPETTGDPNITATTDEGYGDMTLSFLSPDDGTTLLEVGINELYNSTTDPFTEAYGGIEVTADKDGYTLAVTGLYNSDETFRLTGPDGSLVTEGSMTDLEGDKIEGVESTGEFADHELRFFDPDTGKTLVTFDDSDMASAYEAADEEVWTLMSEPFTVTQGDYTLTGTYPVGPWVLTSSDGTVVEFEDPFGDPSALSTGAPEGPIAIDPLTQAVTILDDDGNELVTFEHDQISDALPEDSEFRNDETYGLYFSADQGDTWVEILEMRAWATAIAVGDDEILISSGDSPTSAPIRVAIPTS